MLSARERGRSSSHVERARLAISWVQRDSGEELREEGNTGYRDDSLRGEMGRMDQSGVADMESGAEAKSTRLISLMAAVR